MVLLLTCMNIGRRGPPIIVHRAGLIILAFCALKIVYLTPFLLLILLLTWGLQIYYRHFYWETCFSSFDTPLRRFFSCGDSCVTEILERGIILFAQCYIYETTLLYQDSHTCNQETFWHTPWYVWLICLITCDRIHSLWKCHIGSTQKDTDSYLHIPCLTRFLPSSSSELSRRLTHCSALTHMNNVRVILNPRIYVLYDCVDIFRHKNTYTPFIICSFSQSWYRSITLHSNWSLWCSTYW